MWQQRRLVLKGWLRQDLEDLALLGFYWRWKNRKLRHNHVTSWTEKGERAWVLHLGHPDLEWGRKVTNKSSQRYTGLVLCQRDIRKDQALGWESRTQIQSSIINNSPSALVVFPISGPGHWSLHSGQARQALP